MNYRLFELINGREDFLNFVADDVAAELERLAVDVFAVRLIGESNRGVA